MRKGVVDMAVKVYVSIVAEFSPEGKVVPRELIWDDGSKYEIDRVMSASPRAAMKVGGHGIRYECKMLGKTRYVFRENDRWFVEKD